jgi:hypothetical protein
MNQLKRVPAVIFPWALYPNHYAWYVLVGTLDVIVTFVIVAYLGGGEVNELARHILQQHGWPGMVALKYSTVVVVLLVCEIVGRSKPRAGRGLATGAVVISALPVGLGLLQVWAWTHHS